MANRGDTLNGPVITVRYTSPMANVICVEACHFKGGRDHGPAFGILGCCSEVVVADSDEVATLTSGDLTVRVAKGDAWSVDFVAHEVAGDRVAEQVVGAGWASSMSRASYCSPMRPRH